MTNHHPHTLVDSLTPIVRGSAFGSGGGNSSSRSRHQRTPSEIALQLLQEEEEYRKESVNRQLRSIPRN